MLECTPALTVTGVSYSIAQAAAHSGLSIDTLRYYERIGLVDPPARDTAGRRAYSDDDFRWLTFLTRLRTTGMPIRLMREYARLRHGGTATAARRRQILADHRRDVGARIEELRACAAALDFKIENYERITRDEDSAQQVQEATA
ncbi:transcriptional regulator, MerR family [Actinoalloteichus hymeniacidonis]|uniref:Transcriptional regulator, MerR family n=1 Tax=Actinoalloteichus hymeniacidonis TaxID=340345 RepID=A0AAC9HU03_9PSEU|nr:transcriptional regulator, MerR family [Actinoalloteichus hymeniacidonis]